VRTPPATLNVVRDAALSDIFGSPPAQDDEVAPPGVVQALLRHAMSESVSEGIINCLIVTNSGEANVQLTRIHEHLFASKFAATTSTPLLSREQALHIHLNSLVVALFCCRQSMVETTSAWFAG
jgi:hypothetical protein